MGLAGRKQKQRIPNDPRNLSWANNAAKFGQAYLSKLGWDPSQGLGVAGDGRTKAIAVEQKLDMLGIGMQHQREEGGVAWKQNKDFEKLLRRLNGQDEGGSGMKVEGFDRAVGEVEDDPTMVDGAKMEAGELNQGTRDKRKRKNKGGEDEDGDDDRKEKKKRKKSKDESPSSDKDKKKKKSKSSSGDDELPPSTSTSTPVEIAVADIPIAAPTPIRAPPRAHRARNIRAKRLASLTPSALSEILGIPSTSTTPKPGSSSLSTSSTPSTAPQLEGKLTVIDDAAANDLHKLRTSTQSVADYFKAKLAAKSSSASGSKLKEEVLAHDEAAEREEEEEPRRMGLGSSSSIGRGLGFVSGGGTGAGGLGFAPASSTLVQGDDAADADRVGLGASKSGLKFAGMFASAGISTPTTVEVETMVETEVVTGNVDDEKEVRRKAKEKKRSEKERRKAEKAEAKGKGKAKAVEPHADGPVTDEVVEEVDAIMEVSGPQKKKKDKKKRVEEDAMKVSEEGRTAKERKKETRRKREMDADAGVEVVEELAGENTAKKIKKSKSKKKELAVE